MRARAALTAEVDGDGMTRLTRIRSEPPLVLRATARGVYMVGGAGGPLGGDEIALDIDVGPGATLTVRTAAASIALPGEGPSSISVTAGVAAGGRLRWLPEPVVAVRGCRHHMESVLVLGREATAVWREEIVLGRHGEASGSVRSRLAVDSDGIPLLRHELGLGPAHPAADGPAVAGQALAVGSVVLVDPRWDACPPPVRIVGPTAAILPLAGPGVVVTATASDSIALRRALDAGVWLAEAHTAATSAP